ncbi:MAG: hypothetical protein JJU29_11205 [Verrucomicrobia bacterium]|nr:hypothetical protein [Verrucomicrobiota bacterium]MCH8512825.1 hypothetical protein [Kiritimatiellia bacterium]
MKHCLFILLFFGFAWASNPLQSLTADGVAGRDTEWNATLVWKPIQNQALLEGDAGRFGYHIEPWLRWNSEDKFRGVSRPRMEQAPVIDFREVYGLWEGESLNLKMGRVVPASGFNRMISPSSIAPLNFHDPIHPDRTGLWGGTLHLDSRAWLMVYQTQASLVPDQGPRRVIPPPFERGEVLYGRDTGVSIGIAGGKGIFLWQWTNNWGVTDIPLPEPSENNPGQVDLFYDRSFSSSFSTEISHDLVGIRNDVRYERVSGRDDQWWGVFELDRTRYFHSFDRTLNLNLFWAYSKGYDGLPAYERLRRNALGMQFSFDLTPDSRLKILQELVIGTLENDLYSKSSFQYALASSQWITLSYEHREFKEFTGDQEGLWSLVYRQWFW